MGLGFTSAAPTAWSGDLFHLRARELCRGELSAARQSAAADQPVDGGDVDGEDARGFVAGNAIAPSLRHAAPSTDKRLGFFGRQGAGRLVARS